MTPLNIKTNPAELVIHCFQQIHDQRMQGLPILNQALSVDCIGMQQWQGHWVGVLVTPWVMSLMILRGETEWPQTERGAVHNWSFPSGEYEMTADHEPTLGDYFSCSLASPMSSFKDQATVVTTAAEIMQLLLTLSSDEDDKARSETAAGRLDMEKAHSDQTVSRRDFLRGSLRGK